MSRHCRLPTAFAAVLAAGVLATGAHAADGVRQKARVRVKTPVTAIIHHSGGYTELPPGNALVGSIERIASAPESWSPFSTVGYYDDGANCVIRGVGGAFFFAPHFARVCRIAE